MNRHPELWHHLSQEDVFEALRSDHQYGLSDAEVAERRRLFGSNAITRKQPLSPYKRFLLQFHNPLIYILILAGGVAIALGEIVDASVILTVVIINALIGYLQESKAEAAIGALRDLLTSQATVIREGEKRQVPSSELVPGDIVLLTSGDKVSADLRLFASRDLRIDESTLSGESLSASKEAVRLEAQTLLADRVNMAFAGTLVTYGQGKGIVIAIGDSTETGKIAHLIGEATALQTPLTRKISEFSAFLLYVILALCALTFGVALLRGFDSADAFMAIVALAVAAIPEGLPAVVTITLAIGVAKMASRNTIIRKLPAVETLGSTTVICTDKTGTLTENQMTVRHIYAGGKHYTLSGNGYDPRGELTHGGETIATAEGSALHETLKAGLLCNDALLVHREGRYRIEGDPTEGALVVSSAKAGLERPVIEQNHPRRDAIAFESDRQYMATLHDNAQFGSTVYLKGSPEQILALCTTLLDGSGNLVPLDPRHIAAEAGALASQGLRVLAFAAGYHAPRSTVSLDPLRNRERSDFTFLGLQTMIDPPREEAVRAVEACRTARIGVKMITGDHAATAEAIARQLGIGTLSPEGGIRVLTGEELERMGDHELLRRAREVDVFARVAPEQKLKLISALQAKGEIVAMTGDGVNDAPALKQADIGIAMGAGGTEVAREAADMVLTDDNFASIVAAVEEGRGVYDNLIKFIVWVLPTNLGQGMLIMLSILAGTTLPVLPVQALWLNMTAAVFLGLTLAFEPKERGIMSRPPRSPEEPMLGRELIGRILLISVFLLAGAFGMFEWALREGRPIEEARTLAVTLFVIVQSFFLINCRTLRSGVFGISPLSNPWLLGGIALMGASQLLYVYSPLMNTLFHSAPIRSGDWYLMIGYGIVSLLVIEGEKALWKRRRN